MTLLKVYSKNGSGEKPEYAPYGLTSLLNEFVNNDIFLAETRYGAPRVNIKEDQTSYKIEMEVPGIDKKNLKINLEKEMLSISHNAQEPENNDMKFTYKEFSLGNFERSFRIPQTVDPDKISGIFRDGILIVSLPKKEEAIDKGPRTIEIS